MGYFCTAMYVEATRGQFKKIYAISESNAFPDIAEEQDLQKALRLEQIELCVDRLAYFDRTIIRLYIDGHNMADVAAEAGIRPATIYQSISRTKQKITDAIRNARNKGRTSGHL